MSTHSKRSKTKLQPLELFVGNISEELEAPLTSEIVFRKIWRIRKFKKTISRRETIDSPNFRCSVNGLTTYWNMSIRFWKGPNGKKVTNPVVLCLNLTGCETEEIGQARVRFQFGVWDASIKHWECCPISSVVLNLENTHELHSIGYKTLGILDRHLDSVKDVSIMVKIQVIQSDEEKHSLSQDFARILSLENEELTDTIIDTMGEEKPETLKAHSLIIRSRSAILARKLRDYSDPNNKNIKYRLNLTEINHQIAQELFRYIYSDKVDNAEACVNKLLPLSTRFNLPGLTTLCERVLLENLTPSNIGNILLLADQCGCENLKKAALHYCEESDEIKDSVQIGKTLAWRVMEMVNPDLFLEACESIGSSSSNLDSPSTPGSFSDF
ncbi:TD and POZ domain-containing protein 5-like isoform X2 [Onthophagus taurus]|nr:uncharacterized protein LOC111420098 isoform X2 [Onthophagus taurus]